MTEGGREGGRDPGGLEDGGGGITTYQIRNNRRKTAVPADSHVRAIKEGGFIQHQLNFSAVHAATITAIPFLVCHRPYPIPPTPLLPLENTGQSRGRSAELDGPAVNFQPLSSSEFVSIVSGFALGDCPSTAACALVSSPPYAQTS